MLAWESMADREAKWGAFTSDPEWKEARERSEANGPLVQTVSNQFLQPADFSPLA